MQQRELLCTVDFFLLKSLVLKPYEKSIRRFKLAKRELGTLTIGLPSERKHSMFLPITSVDYSLQESAVFDHQFSAIEPADEVTNPILTVNREYRAIKFVQTDNHIDLHAERTISVPEWNDIKLEHSFVLKLPLTMVDSVGHHCTISCDGENGFRYQSADCCFDFKRIGEFCFTLLATKPSDILVEVLHNCIIEMELSRKKELKLPDRIVETVSACLRYFQIQLDLLNKKVFALCQRSSLGIQNLHKKELLESRIRILETMIEFWNGPLQIIAASENEVANKLGWIQDLNSKLDQAKSFTVAGSIHTLPPEQLFNWQLCSLESSSTLWWCQQFTLLSEDLVSEFVERTKTFVNARYVEPPEQISKWKRAARGFQASILMNAWNKKLVLSSRDQPILYTTSVISESPPNRRKNKSRRYISAATKNRSRKNSFNLPPHQRTAECQRIFRNECNILFELNETGFTYVILASESLATRAPSFAEQFKYTEPGIWSSEGDVLWPSALAAAEGQQISWECLLLEFTLQNVCLVCVRSSQLHLMMFDPFSPEAHKTWTTLTIDSPFDRLTNSEFCARVQLFYQQFHDPFRSDTFTFFQSEKVLLWAVLTVEGYQNTDWFVDLQLLLTAYSVSADALELKFQFTSTPERQWLCMGSALLGKTEMDVRHNIDVSFYFSWRRAVGYILGVWLRADGCYQIYTMMKQRFVLCSQKRSCPFLEHFMTELLPTAAGTVGLSPMVFRRNHTLKLLGNACSFELFELRLEIN